MYSLVLGHIPYTLLSTFIVLRIGFLVFDLFLHAIMRHGQLISKLKGYVGGSRNAVSEKDSKNKLE